MCGITVPVVVAVGSAFLAGAAVCAQPGTTVRVSVGAGVNGAEANSHSSRASICADGRFVAFESYASNLVAGDTNDTNDIFVRDLMTGTTMGVSVGAGGAEANGSSSVPSISADGRFVAFNSRASNLVASDTNGASDIFVRDLQSDATTRVSVGSGGAEANGYSTVASISADGRFVAFDSSATNLVPGDTNNRVDIFVRDLQTGTTTRVSVGSGVNGVESNSDSLAPSISADGRFVAYSSGASNLVAGDTNSVDIFVRDLQTATTIRASVGAGDAQANSSSYAPSISTDGGFVAFLSYASNLVAGDTNGERDVFVRDLLTGSTTRASVGAGGGEANEISGIPSISADGRFVAFGSRASNLVAGDTNGSEDVFVRDLQAGTTTRVSVGAGGAEANHLSSNPSISPDGRFLAFESSAYNLVAGDTNGRRDIFIHERATCPADLTGDGLINSADLSQLLGAWGPDTGPADITGDGVINSEDLTQLLGAWGACP